MGKLIMKKLYIILAFLIVSCGAQKVVEISNARTTTKSVARNDENQAYINAFETHTRVAQDNQIELYQSLDFLIGQLEEQQDGLTNEISVLKQQVATQQAEILAVNKRVDSIINSGEVQIPDAPLNLKANNVTASAIDLVWSNLDSSVTDYLVHQNNVLIATTQTPNYKVTSLSPDTNYSFFITAKNDSGAQSPPSNTINVTTSSPEPVKAFPAIKGAGSEATGGRGGIVVRVTNLNNSGSGSLRDALLMTVPRIIVFEVSGTIHWNTHVELIKENSNFTILGQTAPRGGITISGNYLRLGGGWNRAQQPCDNVIIRYIRFRNGGYTGEPDVAEHNGVISTGCDKLVFEHCSFSFCDDQALALGGNYGDFKDVTIQRCIFSENATQVILGFNATTYTGELTVIENAFIDTSQRTPNMGGDGQYDVINNYYFNWRSRLSNINDGSPEVNYIGNYLQEGSWSTPSSANKYQAGSPTIYTAYNYHSRIYKTPQENDRNLWQGFYSGSTISSSYFTSTQFPLMYDVVPMSAFDVPNILDDIGANKYLNADGTYGVYSDNFDVLKINNARNNISTDPQNKDWTLPTLPLNTRPSNYDANKNGVSDIWEANNIPSGKTVTDISPSGYEYRELFWNAVDN